MRVLAAVAVLFVATPAFGEARSLSGFNQVNASGRFDVEVRVGDHYAVNVEGPDASRVRTVVEGDTLKIEPTSRPWFGPEPQLDARVVVVLPELEGIAGARGVDLVVSAGGDCGSFSAAAAMGATVTVSALQCRTVDASAAMGAELTLNGTCDGLDASAAMGAVVRAAELRCSVVDVSAAMGADVTVFASEGYDASAVMGASINLSGQPSYGDRSAIMGGSISVNQ
jgi:hypothetical protein